MSSISYDESRDYMEKPLNINYKILPKENAVFGDTQWVFMCFARCGNRPSTFRELQVILDQIKIGNNCRINTTITHANNRARECKSGIIHDKNSNNPCLTPNYHHVCTRRAKSINPEETRKTVVAYIDTALLPIFNDSGVDTLYPNMQLLPKRKRTDTFPKPNDTPRKRKRTNQKESPVRKRNITKNTTQSTFSDFSEDMLPDLPPVTVQPIISPPHPVRSRTPPKRNSLPRYIREDESHPSSHMNTGSYDYIFDAQPLENLDDLDFSDILDEDNSQKQDEAEEDAVGSNYEEEQDEEEGEEQNKTMIVASDSLHIAPTLDFFDALEAFFSEQNAESSSNMLPLFTDEIVNNTCNMIQTNNNQTEFDSAELFNILQESNTVTAVDTSFHYNNGSLTNFPYNNGFEPVYNFNAPMNAMAFQQQQQQQQYPDSHNSQFPVYSGNNGFYNANFVPSAPVVPTHSVLSDFDDLFAM